MFWHLRLRCGLWYLVLCIKLLLKILEIFVHLVHYKEILRQKSLTGCVLRRIELWLKLCSFLIRNLSCSLFGQSLLVLNLKVFSITVLINFCITGMPLAYLNKLEPEQVSSRTN